MPLRQFNADLAAASKRAAEGLTPGVSSITKGDSDGELVLMYEHENLEDVLSIRLLCQGKYSSADNNCCSDLNTQMLTTTPT